jgi:polyhydroxybutyrate depolymerase
MLPTRRFIGSLVVMLWACQSVDEPAGAGAPASPQGGAAVPGGPAAPGSEPGSGDTPPAPFACAPGRAGATGDRTLTITAGEQERTVLLHVPAGYEPTKGTPLVLGFHGYGGNAEGMRAQTGFDAEAEQRGLIVAYVLGTGTASKGFNAGDCCGAPAWTSDTDDLGLAREIHKKIDAEYCVDPKRVYSAGFSNGGFMSYRFACEAADLFAAVASVSGVLGLPPESCKPARPVPILHIHGTADRTVAYEGGGAAGGLGSLVGIKFLSVADSVATFRTKWACGETSKEVVTAGDTRCEEWTGCQGDARIELCTVTDGGHQWPGGKANPGSGKTSDFGATKAVLDFFAAHPMR